MKPKWSIHDGVFGDEQPRFVECLDKHGISYEIVGLHDKVRGDIVRCSTQKAKLLHGYSGLMCDWKAFLRYSYYGKYVGFLLNKQFVFTTYGELLCNTAYYGYKFGSTVFLAPDSGDKVFYAELVDLHRLDKHRGEYLHGWDDGLKILIAPKLDITEEFRFVVSDRVIAGTKYKENCELEVAPISSDHSAWKYADQVVREVDYRPGELFVLDVGIVRGKYGVVELNSFSCSGLYDCDPEPIILHFESRSV